MEPGESAARPVVLEFKSARALAPILLRLMAVHSVQGPAKKLRSAIMAPAQVSKEPYPLLPRRNGQFLSLFVINYTLSIASLLVTLFNFSPLYLFLCFYVKMTESLTD